MVLWEGEVKKFGNQSKMPDKLEKVSNEVSGIGKHKHLTFSIEGTQLVLFEEGGG